MYIHPGISSLRVFIAVVPNLVWNAKGFVKKMIYHTKFNPELYKKC